MTEEAMTETTEMMTNMGVSPLQQAIIDSPLGHISLWAGEEGITSVSFTEKPCIDLPNHPLLCKVAKELESYFLGKCRSFTVPLSPLGTPFQLKVWDALIKVPHGQVLSYKELALASGHPKALRAVGTAVGKNPIGILIPCHRIIRSDGTIGNYTGGVHIKEFLLLHEGIPPFRKEL